MKWVSLDIFIILFQCKKNSRITTKENDLKTIQMIKIMKKKFEEKTAVKTKSVIDMQADAI